MGRVTTEAAIENMEDLWAIKRGLLTSEQARRVMIPDALVDTGATLLSLPTRIIQQLGLARTVSKRVPSSIGLGEAYLYEAVRLTIQGRSCTYGRDGSAGHRSRSDRSIASRTPRLGRRSPQSNPHW